MPNPILFFQPLEKFLSDSNIQNLEMEFESQFYDEKEPSAAEQSL